LCLVVGGEQRWGGSVTLKPDASLERSARHRGNLSARLIHLRSAQLDVRALNWNVFLFLSAEQIVCGG
jgi:hypothetical protein